MNVLNTFERIESVIVNLSLAFGGSSQWGWDDLGRALAGQTANNGLFGTPGMLNFTATEQEKLRCRIMGGLKYAHTRALWEEATEDQEKEGWEKLCLAFWQAYSLPPVNPNAK